MSNQPPQAVVYVPIVQAFPVFAGVHHVEVPPSYGKDNISPELWGILSSSNVFTIRQHLKLLPKNCCGCPPCAPQTATFSMYAGPSAESQHELIRFDEVSDDWNRCCCRPYHPLKLEARQHIPMPGDGNNVSDYSHLTSDMRNDWSRFTDKQSQSRWLLDFYRNQPVLFTVQRDDGVRCCFKCPCKMLSFPVCCSYCQDGAHVYAGATPDLDPKAELGRPLPHDAGHYTRLIGSVKQPQWGGCCIPYLQLRDAEDTAEPFGKVAGPCFFGGWSEMCFSFKFLISRFSSDRSSGDIGSITKRRPVTASQAAATLCCNGDADVYSVEFNTNAPTSTAQKVTALSAQLLIDYMLFDGQMQKWEIKDEVLYCYFCYCSIIGQLVPCCIAIPLKSG